MDISIIIPCYNRELTIQRAIQSVLNQTLFLKEDITYEVIVVDDFSSDHSVERILELNNKNVKLIELGENRGGNFARNKGIEVSKGKYVAFQDSDDVWLERKLEIQFNALAHNKADIVFSSLISSDKDVETIVPKGLNEGFAKIEDFLSFNKMSTQVILGKRECFVSQPFDNELKRFQDWELALRLVANFRLYFIKEPLAIQYIQENSVTRNNRKAYDSLLIIEQKHRDLFSTNSKYYAKLFETIAYFAIKLEIDSNNYIKKALTIHFSTKLFLKYLLNKISIYQTFVKKKS